jgi:DNA (cytosine-5)-methyltransferase 1
MDEFKWRFDPLSGWGGSTGDAWNNALAGSKLTEEERLAREALRNSDDAHDGTAPDVPVRVGTQDYPVIGQWAAIRVETDKETDEIDDISTFVRTPLLLHKSLRELVGRVDIVIGGPPCEGHSNYNNSTRRNDPRNLLYLVPLALGMAVGAKAIIIENVPEVTRDRFAGVTALAAQLARDRGYFVGDSVVSALSLGVPQTRRRHIFLAAQGQKPNIEQAKKALIAEERDLSFAIKDLVGRAGSSMFDMPAALSVENGRRIGYMFQHGLLNMPNSVRPKCHQNGTRYNSVYGRLSWDLPSGTVTTGFLTPGRGRYIHPDEKRALTPHEAARLQGFPDSFKFRHPAISGNVKGLFKADW